VANLLLAITLLLLAAALYFALRTGLGQRASGLPVGAVIYQDTVRAGEQAAPPLVSRRYGLSGKPDYLVRDGATIIPVEVKTGRTPREPYDSQRIQLFVYCLLVEEEYGVTPPYGILRYPERTFELEYGAAEREWVLETLADLRAEQHAVDVAPNHDAPARCRGCEYLDLCGQDRLRGGLSLLLVCC